MPAFICAPLSAAGPDSEVMTPTLMVWAPATAATPARPAASVAPSSAVLIRFMLVSIDGMGLCRHLCAGISADMRQAAALAGTPYSKDLSGTLASTACSGGTGL